MGCIYVTKLWVISSGDDVDLGIEVRLEEADTLRRCLIDHGNIDQFDGHTSTG
jgi:hypothetical protein